MIGRAKYIPEDELSKFDEIYETMKGQLKALTSGGDDDE
jgi:hypothetical protein